MSRLTRCLFLLLSVSPLTAQPTEQGPKPRHVDALGRTLPNGAIQRFGTTRFYHPDLEEFIVLPGGKSVLSVGGDNMARWWDINTGQQTGSQALADKSLRDIVLSPDGTLLAGRRSTIMLISDPRQGKVRHAFSTAALASDLCFAISPDNSRIAACDNRCLTLYETRTDRTTRIILTTEPLKPSPNSAIPDWPHAAFANDGKRVALGGLAVEKLLVFDTHTGKEIYSRNIHTNAAVFTDQGDCLVVLQFYKDRFDGLGLLRLIDLKTGRDRFDIWVSCEAGGPKLTVSPDGKKLVLAGKRESSLIDTSTGRILRWLPGARKVRFSPDGSRLVLQVQDRLIVVREPTQEGNEGDSSEFCDFGKFAVSPDSRLIAIHNISLGSVEIRDARTAKLVRTLPGAGGHLSGMVFAESGRIVRACGGGQIRSWTLTTGRMIVTSLPRNIQGTAEIDLGGNGRVLETVGESHPYMTPIDRYEVRDPNTGQLLNRISEEEPALDSHFAWWPDGEHLIGSDDRRMTVFNAMTGRVAMVFPKSGHYSSATVDGRWLAVDAVSEKSGEQARLLVETATGGEIDVLPNKYAFGCPVKIHGRTAAVESDGTLQLIDLALGIKRASFKLAVGQSNESPDHVRAEDVRFFPDGKTVLTVLDDGTILSWDLSLLPLAALSATHTEDDLSKWWSDLAHADAKKAYAAVWRLAETPPETLMQFLRQRLRPITAPTPEEFRRLIADLDHREFRIRVGASRRLDQIGPVIADELRQELRRTPSAEVRERLGQLTEKHTGPIPPPETLRFLRALAVLEEVKTVEARRLVEELSHGVASARETKAAVSTLARMPHPESWGR